MSIWNTSDGEKVESTGDAEIGGGDLTPIPAGTKLKAIITEAKWDTIQDSAEQYIKLRWDVLDGEFKGRVIFHKVRVYNEDASKADKQRKMFAAIDANCGGKLLASGDDPTDFTLVANLANKPMFIVVGTWDDAATKLPKGNWVMAVSGKNSPAQSAEKFDPDEDGIPF